MKRLVLILAFVSPSLAFADASKDAVAGAVMHGEVKVPSKDEKKAPVVKDEPTASKTATFAFFSAGKTK
jgi:hypothetical protein